MPYEDMFDQEVQFEDRPGKASVTCAARVSGGEVSVLDEQAAIFDVGDYITYSPVAGIVHRLKIEQTEIKPGVSRTFPTRVVFRVRRVDAGGMPLGESFSNNGTANQSISVSGIGAGASVVIGDRNAVQIVNAFNALQNAIEASDSSPKDKAEARTLLGRVLKNGLVQSILGGAAAGVASSLVT